MWLAKNESFKVSRSFIAYGIRLVLLIWTATIEFITSYGRVNLYSLVDSFHLVPWIDPERCTPTYQVSSSFLPRSSLLWCVSLHLPADGDQSNGGGKLGVGLVLGVTRPQIFSQQLTVLELLLLDVRTLLQLLHQSVCAKQHDQVEEAKRGVVLHPVANLKEKIIWILNSWRSAKFSRGRSTKRETKNCKVIFAASSSISRSLKDQHQRGWKPLDSLRRMRQQVSQQSYLLLQ